MEWTWMQQSSDTDSPSKIIVHVEEVGDSEMLVDSQVNSEYDEDDAVSCCYDSDYEHKDNSCASNEDSGHSIEDVRIMKKPASNPELDRLFWETCLETGLPMD